MMTTADAEEKKDIHARVYLPASDPLNQKFRAIMADIGLHSYAEVLRFLVRRYRLKREGRSDGRN